MGMETYHINNARVSGRKFSWEVYELIRVAESGYAVRIHIQEQGEVK